MIVDTHNPHPVKRHQLAAELAELHSTVQTMIERITFAALEVEPELSTLNTVDCLLRLAAARDQVQLAGTSLRAAYPRVLEEPGWLPACTLGGAA